MFRLMWFCYDGTNETFFGEQTEKATVNLEKGKENGIIKSWI